MTLKQKKAINNLRKAWKFYKQCKSEDDLEATDAQQDVVERLETAIQELMDCTVYYETRKGL